MIPPKEIKPANQFFQGNYGDQIGQALHDSGHGSANHDKVIFYCEGGDDGLIKFAKECPGGCVDNGDGISDVCEVVPRSFRRRNVAM
ncbi:hypothetical protein K505DRAFT_324012 [Melanomma pulvis-pyrius CBS 109.77]|uniref:Uncharacterized protein n=1 Tax=Melanomma pulvis-pyrius CBS 109.77 TaxID=1314802 RepID=A0A6A6XGK7_9PLEO|nr:hypothetical protein K505DRAFT_324012 [Melanomma pulvis-pyrius CBS 109.77]